MLNHFQGVLLCPPDVRLSISSYTSAHPSFPCHPFILMLPIQLIPDYSPQLIHSLPPSITHSHTHLFIHVFS